MPKARKDHGNCEFCNLPILKGDDWSQGADLDDGWMETKHGMRVRPGQPYQSFHTICYEFVVGDAEGYSDPSDDLYEVLYNTFGYSENHGKDWKEIINLPVPEGEHPDNVKLFNAWKTFVESRIEKEPDADGRTD